MITWRPRPLALDEVATVVLGGWLAGTAVFGTGAALVAVIGMAQDGQAGALLLFPQLLFLFLFGAGLFSIAWVLPPALLLVSALKIVGAGRRTALLVCLGVGCAYALRIPELSAEGPWWSDFWYTGPIYGGAMGLIYTRTEYA